jgi:hypothetical protein
VTLAIISRIHNAVSFLVLLLEQGLQFRKYHNHGAHQELKLWVLAQMRRAQEGMFAQVLSCSSILAVRQRSQRFRNPRHFNKLIGPSCSL